MFFLWGREEGRVRVGLAMRSVRTLFLEGGEGSGVEGSGEEGSGEEKSGEENRRVEREGREGRGGGLWLSTSQQLTAAHSRLLLSDSGAGCWVAE